MKSFIIVQSYAENQVHEIRRINAGLGIRFLYSFKLSSLSILTIFLLVYDTLIILSKRFELLFLMLGLETWISTSLSASLYFSLCKHIPSFPAGSNTDGCLIATEAKMLH